MPPKLQIRFGNHAAKDLGPVLSCDRIQSTGRAQTDPFQGIVYGSEIVLAQVALLEGHSYNQNIKAKKKAFARRAEDFRSLEDSTTSCWAFSEPYRMHRTGVKLNRDGGVPQIVNPTNLAFGE